MNLLRRVVHLAVVAVLLASLTAAAGETQLWGLWRFKTASVDFPEKCRSMYLRFDENGIHEVGSGQLIMRMRYRMVAKETGAVVYFSYLSDNNLPNCQGLSAEFVRQNSLDAALVQFIDTPEGLRFHFGQSEDSEYMELVRQK